MEAPLKDLELLRYSRQLKLPEVGHEGQVRLKQARILVVGCGGLGCPVIMTLAAAGVGTLGLIDPDVVEMANLNRQWLYDPREAGEPKVERARERVKLFNPECKLECYYRSFDEEIGSSLVTSYDVIVDCSDNFATRYLVNDLCVEEMKPFVSASIQGFEGQLSVFNYRHKGVLGPTYRCLYPTVPRETLTCSEAGVLGVVPMVLGSLQANEVLKLLLGIGEPLSGKLLVLNTLTLGTKILKVSRGDEADVPRSSSEISALELINRLSQGDIIRLIDLREVDEERGEVVRGDWIPISNFSEATLTPSTTVLYCKSGRRSFALCDELRSKGRKNIYSLSSGIEGMKADGILEKIKKVTG